MTSSNLINQGLVTDTALVPKDQGSHTRAEISPEHRADTTGLCDVTCSPRLSFSQGVTRLSSSTETSWEVVAPEDVQGSTLGENEHCPDPQPPAPGAFC